MVFGILQEEFEFDQNTSLANAKAEGEVKGRAEGRAEGKAEGKNEANEETAKRMLELGLEIEIIEKATGLSKEEILRLK